MRLFFLSLLLAPLVATSALGGTIIKPDCFAEKNFAQCISDGRIEQIYIFDEIDDKDLQRIAIIASQLPPTKPFPKVVLNSDGGIVDAAIGIGRLLRWRKASVETHDIFQPERTPMCFSACILVAAGAVERNLDVIGIHSGYLNKRIKGERFEATKLSEETKKRIDDYYIEMGVSPEVIEIQDKTPSEKMARFYFVLEQPLERQKIHQLGFRMRGSNSTDVERLGKRDELAKWSNGSLNQVAKLGDVDAQFKLGKNALHGLNGFPQDLNAALYWLNKAADNNDTRALHLLAVSYSFGYDGLTVNKKLAAEYYLRAAKLGYGGSQNNLAWAYFKGDGVEKNLYEAIYWATKATERGDYFSYGSLGAIRFETDVFVRDDIETYFWLKLGTDLMPKGSGYENDMKMLNTLKSRMTNEQISKADELVKQWKPLKQGTEQMRDKDD